MEAIGGQSTEVNLTRFLCGIYTPVFSNLKIKKLPNFGILENYPYLEVSNWITGHAKVTNDS
jgi:ATP-dependent DNA helicase RecQ